jgi:hypothetical protein
MLFALDDRRLIVPQGLFFACRVLCTEPDKLDFVVFQKSEIARRHDVRVASVGYQNKIEAEAEIARLGGVIPTGFSMFLDFFDEDLETVWCWKDERTWGASQIFKSEREALDAWNTEELVFDALLD